MKKLDYVWFFISCFWYFLKNYGLIYDCRLGEWFPNGKVQTAFGYAWNCCKKDIKYRKNYSLFR